MVRHVVFFRFKDDKKIHLEEAIAKLKGMDGLIPGVLAISAGIDFLGSPRSWDLALIVDLDSKEALSAYQVHPAHVPVKEFLGSLYQEAASVDFEISFTL